MQNYNQIKDMVNELEADDEHDKLVTLLLVEIRCRDRRMETMEAGIADLTDTLKQLTDKGNK